MKTVKKTVSLFLLPAMLLPANALSQGYNSPFDEPSNIFYEFLLYATFYSVVGNYRAEDHLHNDLTDYPWQNRKSGNYTASDDAETRYFRVDAENHILFGGNNVYGNHLDIKIRPFRYFYLQSDFFQIVEWNRAMNHPSLSVFHFSFCYDRLRFQRFNLGWTLGFNYVANRIRRIGFSGGLNLDWFVLKPLSIHSSANFGANHDYFESLIRYHYKKVSFSAGYETLQAFVPRHHFVTAGFGVYL